MAEGPRSDQQKQNECTSENDREAPGVEFIPFDELRLIAERITNEDAGLLRRLAQ